MRLSRGRVALGDGEARAHAPGRDDPRRPAGEPRGDRRDARDAALLVLVVAELAELEPWLLERGGASAVIGASGSRSRIPSRISSLYGSSASRMRRSASSAKSVTNGPYHCAAIANAQVVLAISCGLNSLLVLNASARADVNPTVS